MKKCQYLRLKNGDVDVMPPTLYSATIFITGIDNFINIKRNRFSEQAFDFFIVEVNRTSNNKVIIIRVLIDLIN